MSRFAERSRYFSNLDFSGVFRKGTYLYFPPSTERWTAGLLTALPQAQNVSLTKFFSRAPVAQPALTLVTPTRPADPMLVSRGPGYNLWEHLKLAFATFFHLLFFHCYISYLILNWKLFCHLICINIGQNFGLVRWCSYSIFVSCCHSMLQVC